VRAAALGDASTMEELLIESDVKADSSLDDAVAAVLGGDREAYRRIIEDCEAKVRIVVAAILPDENAVQDVAQEVFVTAYSKLSRYTIGSDFVLWIKAIARNIALNERKRWLRQSRTRDKFECELESLLDANTRDFAASFTGNLFDALNECVERLDESSRRVTEEFYYNGLSGEEVAHKLERKHAWVRLTLFRARTALAACLQSKGVSS
jgi:RNA polymerase sigma-70 factor (ECF subfamily)